MLLKNKTQSQLIKEADKQFSIFIRRRDVDGSGYGKCCTCNKRINWKEGDCGHYISRSWHSVRHNEKNAALQCKGDNGYKGGCPPEFALYLINRWGAGILEELNRLKRNRPPQRKELIKIIKHYKKLNKEYEL